MNVVRFNVLESTNTEALQKDYPQGTVVVANFQTAGRGQRGNVWRSETSKNLTMSVVHYPSVSLLNSFPISMAAAVSIVDLLSSYGIEARIKWPNDIYVGDCKIAGILIENSLSGDSIIRKSVIGIGLNVSQKEFPKDVPNATSMVLCGCDVTPEDVLRKFSINFDFNPGELEKKYMSLLWRRTGFYPYADAGGEFMAEISGIDFHTGRLSLRRTDGSVGEYYFKEVQALLK